jgi:hypothetical protein
MEKLLEAMFSIQCVLRPCNKDLWFMQDLGVGQLEQEWFCEPLSLQLHSQPTTPGLD